MDPWLCFSPCKNNTADAAKAQVRRFIAFECMAPVLLQQRETSNDLVPINKVARETPKCVRRRPIYHTRPLTGISSQDEHGHNILKKEKNNKITSATPVTTLLRLRPCRVASWSPFSPPWFWLFQTFAFFCVSNFALLHPCTRLPLRMDMTVCSRCSFLCLQSRTAASTRTLLRGTMVLI